MPPQHEQRAGRTRRCLRATSSCLSGRAFLTARTKHIRLWFERLAALATAKNLPPIWCAQFDAGYCRSIRSCVPASSAARANDWALALYPTGITSNVEIPLNKLKSKRIGSPFLVICRTGPIHFLVHQDTIPGDMPAKDMPEFVGSEPCRMFGVFTQHYPVVTTFHRCHPVHLLGLWRKGRHVEHWKPDRPAVIQESVQANPRCSFTQDQLSDSGRRWKRRSWEQGRPA